MDPAFRYCGMEDFRTWEVREPLFIRLGSRFLPRLTTGLCIARLHPPCLAQAGPYIGRSLRATAIERGAPVGKVERRLAGWRHADRLLATLDRTYRPY